MPDVRLFVVAEGVDGAIAELGKLNQATQQQQAKLQQGTALNLQTVTRLNRALSATSRALNVSGTVSQLVNLNVAALNVAQTVNALASISKSGVVARAAAGGSIIGMLLWGGAAGYMKIQNIMDQIAPHELLAAGIGPSAERLVNEIERLNKAGQISAAQYAALNQELNKIVQVEKKIGSLGDNWDRIWDGSSATEQVATMLSDTFMKTRVAAMEHYEAQKRILDTKIEDARLSLSIAEADGKSVAVLKEYRDALEKALAVRFSLSTDAKNSGLIDGTEHTQELIKTRQAQLALKPENPIVTFQRQMEEMSRMGHMAVAPYQGMFDGLTSSMVGLLNLTMTWSQALQNVGTHVLQSIIRGFSEMVSSWVTSMALMVAKWVSSHVIMKGVMAAFHIFARLLGWESTKEQIAQESSKAPVLATNAATASVSSYGAAAVVGMALALAAIGAVIGFALGAFKEGGYTGNGGVNDIAGVVHGREFVFEAPAVDRIGQDNLEAIRRGDVASVGGGRDVNVFMVWDEQELRDRIMNSPDADNRFVDMYGRNRHRIT